MITGSEVGMGPNDRGDDDDKRDQEHQDSITYFEQSLQDALEDSIRDQRDDRDRRDDK